MAVSAKSRVENQKLNQTAAQGWVFGFQLDLLEQNLVSLAVFTFSHQAISKVVDDGDVIGNTNTCLYLLKQSWRKTQSNELLFTWVFGVQLDRLEKSVLANAEKRLDFIPTFLAT